jgi:hypothetical protein
MTEDKDKEFERYLERRAEQLGLPTDPEAYQDGGLAEACTCMTLGEAETLVAALKSEGVPAWVKAPAAAMAAASPLVFPILVPRGRLADAQGLLAEHAAGRAGQPEEAEEEAAEGVTAPAEPPRSAPRRKRAHLLAAILILGFGVGELLLVAGALVFEGMPRGVYEIGAMICVAVFAVAALAIGIISLRAYWVSGGGQKGELAASLPAPKEIPAAPTEEPAEETPAPAVSWSGVRLAAGVFLLVVGLFGLAYAVSLISEIPNPLAWAVLAVIVGLSVAVCIAGIRVMRVPPEERT